MANELITIERKNVAGIIKVFDNDTRKAIDEALAISNDFARAHNDEAKRVNVARAIAVYRIAKDAEAIEKTGFKTFKDVASALFGLAPANATNYRKAAEQFYCNDNAPVCKDWWGPSTLYLFCAAKVDNDTIKAAIEAGKLSEKSTNDDIKKWITSLEEALDDGKGEVAKLYDAMISVLKAPDGKAPFHNTINVYGLTLDEIKLEMAKAFIANDNLEAPDAVAAGMIADTSRWVKFDPHAELDDGKRKVKASGIACIFPRGMVNAAVFKAKTNKSNGPTADTVKAQNDTIAKMRAAMVAAGLDPDAI